MVKFDISPNGPTVPEIQTSLSWTIVRTEGYTTLDTDNIHKNLEFSFTIERIAGFHIFTLVVPAVLLVVIGASLFVTPAEQDKINLGKCISTIVFY